MLLLLLLLFPNVNLYFSIFIIFISPLLTFLGYLMKDSLTSYKIKMSKNAHFSSEEFQDIINEGVIRLTKSSNLIRWFKEDILLKEKYCHKVVFVIENIDKCSNERVKEILTQLRKTLNIQNTIFILEADEEVLRKIVKDSFYEENEVFRDVFNLIIRLKNYTSKDLFNFTNNVIEKNSLNFSTIVADMVSQEFSNNPRRIIHFLNNLFGELQFCLNQEKTGLLKGVSENVEFLAKILLIKEEWLDLFEKINDNPDLLKVIDNNLKNNSFEHRFIDQKEFFVVDEISLDKQQYLFFSRTRTINSQNPQLFLINKNYDSDIPEKLIEKLFTSNWSEIKQILKSNNINSNRFVEIIYDLLDDTINKKNLINTSGFNLLNIYFNFVNDEEYSDIFDRVYKMFETFIDKKTLNTDLIFNFDVEPLLNYAFSLKSKDELYLRDYIAEIINEFAENVPNNLIKKYLEIFSLDFESLSLIKNTFSKLMLENLDYLEEFKSVLENPKTVKFLIESVYIKNTINIVNELNEDNKKRLNFIEFLNKNDSLNSEERMMLLGKIIILIDEKKKNEMNYFLNYLNKIILKFDSDIFDKNYVLKIHSIFESLIKEKENNENVNLLIDIHYNTLKKIKDKKLFENLITLFKTNEYDVKSNEAILKLVNDYKIENLDFVDYYIDKFRTVSNIDKKDKISQTLIQLMFLSMEKKMLEEKVIYEIINMFFEELFNIKPLNAEIPLKWLEKTAKFIHVKHIFEEIISKLTSKEHFNRVLWIANKTDADDLKRFIVKNTIEACKSYYDLKQIIGLIEDNLNNDYDYIIDPLLDLFKFVTHDNNPEYHKGIIEICVLKKNLFNEENFSIIADELKPLLISKSKSNNKFALASLLEIFDNIPKKKIGSLKNILVDENFETENDEEFKTILEKIKEKFKLK
jgi:hypothetical protein